jgi:activating signal cointegrator complex subunit 3
MWRLALSSRFVLFLLSGDNFNRYVDFPVTDVLQMMGRAGRPQFDEKGVACVFVHQPKKQFYKRFLYEPFPVESSLKAALHNHLNAEVSGGTIRNKQDAVEYLTWTYFFRRLLVNPAYYGCADASTDTVQAYLLDLVDETLADLQDQGCVDLSPGVPPNSTTAGAASASGERSEDVLVADFKVRPTVAGRVASYYYLDYRSIGVILNGLRGEEKAEGGRSGEELASAAAVCRLLSQCFEFAELPVRHNEDGLNGDLAAQLPWRLMNQSQPLDSPHTKAFLLLQAHCCRAPLPISDYVNDTKSVLDQALRVLNAMVDLAADEGLLGPALHCMRFTQLLVQATMPDQSELAQLPGLSARQAAQAETNLRSKQGGGNTGGGGSRGGGGGQQGASGGLAGLVALYRNQGGKGGSKGGGNGAASLLSAAGASSKALEALEALPDAAITVASLREDDGSKDDDDDDDDDSGSISTNASSSTSAAGSPSFTVTVDSDCTLTLNLSLSAVASKSYSQRNNSNGNNNRAASQQEQQQQQSSNNSRHQNERIRVRTPFYHKAKELGWWLLLGVGDELLALKRVNHSRSQQVSLSFLAPEMSGDQTLDVWLVADCVRGLDFHLPISLSVVD